MQIRSRASVVALVVLYNCLLYGCDWPDPVVDVAGQVSNQVDDTVDLLTVQSENWQQIMEDFQKNLPEQVQSTIRNEVQSLISQSIGITGSEIRCDLDFVVNRLKTGLLRIKAQVLGGEAPRLSPALCQVVPVAIDVTLVPSRLTHLSMYGYNLNRESDIRAYVQSSSNSLRDVSGALDYPTPYSMTLKFGANGAALDSKSERVLLKFSDLELSSIGVVQPVTPACISKTIVRTPNAEEYRPPKVKGDGEFNGNGPHIWAQVTLVVKPTTVDADLYMRAQETGDDDSEAKGTKHVTLYTPDPRWKVDSVVGVQHSYVDYVDRDESSDSFDEGSGGPVKRWVFIGDTQGSDIGTTGVTVTFNSLRIVVTENRNCVSKREVENMVAKRYIGGALNSRLQRTFAKP